jgi:hypothetical protein
MPLPPAFGLDVLLCLAKSNSDCLAVRMMRNEAVDANLGAEPLQATAKNAGSLSVSIRLFRVSRLAVPELERSTKV